MSGINHTQHCLQDSHIWKQFLRYAGHVKQQIQIPDSVRLNLMEYHRNPCHRPFFIKNRCDLTGNIFSFKYRDLFQILRTVFC